MALWMALRITLFLPESHPARARTSFCWSSLSPIRGVPSTFPRLVLSGSHSRVPVCSLSSQTRRGRIGRHFLPVIVHGFLRCFYRRCCRDEVVYGIHLGRQPVLNYFITNVGGNSP